MAVLGSRTLTVLMVRLCERRAILNFNVEVTELRSCESRGGSPCLPVPYSPYGLCGRKATLSCVKVEVAVLVSQSLIVLTDSVDVKQH